MKAQKIKIGFKFKFIKTDRVFEVIKISDKSVWYKDVSRNPNWRRSIKQFLNLINSIEYEKIM